MSEAIRSVIDSDAHFILNPITRALSTESKKRKLIQGDHNSEKFTFELPRYIDGHDMTECNVVQVHYINIENKTKNESADVYEVADLEASGDNVTFSWLISGNATRYAGSLNFLITLKWRDTEGAVEYVYNSDIYTKISISAGIDNSAVVVEEYSDLLESWRASVVADLNSTAQETLNRMYSVEGNVGNLLADVQIVEQRILGYAASIEEAAQNANGAADNANTFANTAVSFAADSETAAERAESARDAAEQAARAASDHAGHSEEEATKAQQYAEKAEQEKSGAERAASNAYFSEGNIASMQEAIDAKVQEFNETARSTEETIYLHRVNASQDADRSEISAQNAQASAEMSYERASYSENCAMLSEQSAGRAAESANLADERASAIEDKTASCSNAVRAEASGAIICVDDVSPNEHTVDIKLKSKNLIPAFTESKSLTRDGITYSVGQGGQSIFIHGTSGSIGDGRNAFSDVVIPILVEKGKTYTLSHRLMSGEAGGNYSVYLTAFGATEVVTSINSYVASKTFTAKKTLECYIGVNVSQNTTYVLAEIVFMLEEGNTASTYEQWIDPTPIILTRCGKNILPYPFPSSAITSKNGITITDNGDGSITVNGTCTNTTNFPILSKPIRVNGIYTFSGLSGGSVTTYYIQPFSGNSSFGGLADGYRTYDFPDVFIDRMNFTIMTGASFNNMKLFLQLEKGDEATDWEAYKGTDFFPNVDGTVEGITSLSPTMNICTDYTRVTIECEYNRDINKIIDGINQDVRTLDDSVSLLAEDVTALQAIPAGAMPKQGVGYHSAVEIPANKLLNFGEMAGDIDVHLGEGAEGYDNIWAFSIKQGATAYDVVLPEIAWTLGIAPSFLANTTTRIDLYYVGETLCGMWECVG